MSDYVESNFGITNFLHKHKGLSGVLKMRFQDFLVNEVDANKHVLRLSSLIYEELDEDTTEDVHKEFADELSLLSENDQKMLKQLQDGSSVESCVLICAGNDKAKRTKIHQLIRHHYPRCESETVDQNDEKKIKVSISNNNTRKRGRQSKEQKKLMRFLLYKENISTMDAVNLMMRKLHLKHAKSFQYAGNKDKRAITVQAMTTTLPIRRILSINSITSNIRIGNFIPCEESLQLGQLWGNRFSIVLRNIKDVDESEISTAVTSLFQVGFINYFGMQRFGTNKISTSQVGKALLAGNWGEAIDFILSAVTDEDESVVEMIKSWREEGNASRAFEKLRKKSTFEGFLLKGIAQYGSKQLVQALNRIPRPTRLLYLHSYQSLLWNKVVSERLQLFGHKPVPGDLVLVKKEDDANSCKNDKEEKQENKRQKLGGKEISPDSRRSFPEVKILAEDEVENYELTDVVLPLPGSMVNYPTNMKSYYIKLLEEDQLTLEVFNHKVKEYSLTGAYRKIVVRPTDVQWDVVRYDDVTTPLLKTDYQKIISNEETVDEGVMKSEGRFRALRIHFDLPSSSYATVALRELTKMDMSIPVQSKLGNEHKLEIIAACSDSAQSIKETQR